MTDQNVTERIAGRVRNLRAARGLSLEHLARASGVSRSMISLIERSETSPTAVVLEKLATALGVTLAALFEPQSQPADPVSRRHDQPVWRDPASGYVRRNVSPSGSLTPIQIVEVEFPAGGEVAYETGPRSPPIHQQIWVLDGAIEIELAGDRFCLTTGDCLAHVLDRPITYRNRSGAMARYAVVIVSSFNPTTGSP